MNNNKQHEQPLIYLLLTLFDLTKDLKLKTTI